MSIQDDIFDVEDFLKEHGGPTEAFDRLYTRFGQIEARLEASEKLLTDIANGGAAIVSLVQQVIKPETPD